MSTSIRSTARTIRSRPEKMNRTQHPDLVGSGDKQHTHNYTSLRPEDKVYEEKISQVVQLTGKTKDEAEIALYDCDYDPTRAINMLLEGEGEGEWVEKTKKKKVVKPAVDNAPVEASRLEDGGERVRPRGGQPPRLRRGAAPDRSWRAREIRENEKNAADSGGGEQRRYGMRGGPRVGRGGRRGGIGSRSFQSRRSVDDWGGNSWSGGGLGSHLSGAGDTLTNDDWDAEDWDEPLTDTKVFVASSTAQPCAASILLEDAAPVAVSPPPASSLDTTVDVTALLAKPAAPVAVACQPTSISTTTNGTATFSELVAAAAAATAAAQPTSSYSYNGAPVRTAQPRPPPVQYPSGYTDPPGLFSSVYTTENLTSQLQSTLKNSSQLSSVEQPASSQTKPYRSKPLPTPKIPDSAVVMPDETVSSLGVKFGRLDFGAADIISNSMSVDPASETYHSSPQKEPAPPLPAAAPPDAESALEPPVNSQYPAAAVSVAPPAGFTGPPAALYASAQKAAASSGFASAASGSGVTFSQLAASYEAAQSQQQQAGFGGSPRQSGGSAFNSNGTVHGGYSAAPEVSAAVSGVGYSSSSSSISQAGASVTMPPVSSDSLASSQSGSVSSAAAVASSASVTFSSSDGLGGGASTYSGPAGFSDTSYQNGNAYSSSGPAGNGASLADNSLQEKLTTVLSNAVKHSQYESSSSAGSLPLTSTAAPSLATTGATAAAGAAARAATTRAGTVPSVPPGVPMQYFVGQTPGMPFYPGMQQMYSYEDMQALQRLPHLAAQQAGSSQGRSDAGSALAGAFSMADAKYSRQDAASPVQSSQIGQQVKSQQQQQQQYFGPAAGIPPNYTYFPFVPQYSIYTSLPPATNTAHQAAAPSGGQYPKLAAYNAAVAGGSGFSSYDPLGSTTLPTADFKSAAAPYVGSAGAGHKLGGSAGGAGANDLYGKMAALGGKFDNKGFHAATPPPYGLAGSAGSTPLAAPGGYAPHMFIQPMPPQHALLHPGHGEPVAGVQQRQTVPASKTAAKPSYGAGYWPAN